MNKKVSFDKLAQRAGQEQHTPVDVADAVLDRLALRQRLQRISYRPLAWIATFSSAAAACVGIAALWWLKTGAAEPLNEVYQAISWVIQ